MAFETRTVEAFGVLMSEGACFLETNGQGYGVLKPFDVSAAREELSVAKKGSYGCKCRKLWRVVPQREKHGDAEERRPWLDSWPASCPMTR